MNEIDMPSWSPTGHPFTLEYIDSLRKYTYSYAEDRIDFRISMLIFHHFGDAVVHFASDDEIQHLNEEGQKEPIRTIILSNKPVLVEKDAMTQLMLGHHVIVPYLNFMGVQKYDLHIQCNPQTHYMTIDPYLPHPCMAIDFGLSGYAYTGLRTKFVESIYFEKTLENKCTRTERRAIRMETRIKKNSKCYSATPSCLERNHQGD